MSKTAPLPTVIGVQYLRGLAAFLVVIDHAAGIMAFTEYSGRSPGTFLSYGAVGVPIFFIISGFIIAVISLNRDLKPILTIGEFFRRRFVRIVPFMWLCVIAYAILRFVGIGEWNWGPFLRAMFLWPIGDVRPNVIWTLRHEFAFYLLFGLTMLGPVRQAWVMVFWFVSPVLLWTIQAIDPQIFLPLPESIQELVGFIGNKVNVCFGAGLALGVIYRRGGASLRPRFKGGFPLILSLGLLEFALLAVTGILYDEFWNSVAIYALSAIVVWFGICVRANDSWISRFGHFLGDASYSIYLVHNPILLILLSGAAKLHLLSGNIWPIYSILIVLTVAGGCAVHVLVERPVVRIGSKLAHQPTPVIIRAEPAKGSARPD